MTRRFILGMGVLLLFVSPAISSGAPLAYVTNHASDSVSVIDLGTETVVATLAVGGAPVGIAVAPNAKRVFVANRASHSISIINAEANVVIATIGLEAIPEDVSIIPRIHPRLTEISFVSRFSLYVAESTANVVTVIDSATRKSIADVLVGAVPQSVQATPDGSAIYAANYGAGTVSVIRSNDNIVQATIQVGNGPVATVFKADGTTAYVLNSSGTVSVIDTASMTVVPGIGTVDTFYVGGVPNQIALGIAIHPSGSSLYFSVYDGRHGYLIEQDATTYGVLRVADLGPLLEPPQRVAVNASGSRVYVTTSTGSFTPGAVLVIDAATFTVTKSIEVGIDPIGIAVGD